MKHIGKISVVKMSALESQPFGESNYLSTEFSQPLIEEDLTAVLTKLCSLSEEESIKKGKLQSSSAFKSSTLKMVAKKQGMVMGSAKPEMIALLRASVAKEKELVSMDEKERNGTYRHDKNTAPRLVNLCMRYPYALQRYSALATRMDLQNKTTNANKPIWVTVAED